MGFPAIRLQRKALLLGGSNDAPKNDSGRFDRPFLTT